MLFPQELCDYFIDHLHDDTNSLRSCGLVCKAWAPPARYHIFHTVYLPSKERLIRWSQIFDTSECSPSHIVKRLTLSEWFSPAVMEEHKLMDHFRSFDNVQELYLRRFDFGNFQGKPLEDYFGHFVSSLRWLEFNWAMTSNPVDLIHMVSLLLNVDDLGIMGLHAGSEGFGEILGHPLVSPTFRGRLRLSTNTHTAGGFISGLVGLPSGVNFQSLYLWFENTEDFRHADRLLEACAETLETLEIGYEFYGVSSSFRFILNESNRV